MCETYSYDPAPVSATYEEDDALHQIHLERLENPHDLSQGNCCCLEFHLLPLSFLCHGCTPSIGNDSISLFYRQLRCLKRSFEFMFIAIELLV